jgi:hypothetical protein
LCAKRRHISEIEVNRIVILTCLRPTAEYRAEGWAASKTGLQLIVCKRRHISEVEVNRIVILTCLRPTAEYRAEGWAASKTGLQLIVCKLMTSSSVQCVWAMHERPCTHAVLAEWGVKPMHIYIQHHLNRLLLMVLVYVIPADPWYAQNGIVAPCRTEKCCSNQVSLRHTFVVAAVEGGQKYALPMIFAEPFTPF